MTKLSILDLAFVPENSDVATTLHHTLKLAQQAENLGFNRFWVAEHHNMRGIASSATSVLMGYLAGGTDKIRIGAGGVMLPNHAPLVIAEQFGTLAELYPGRIDLGLGRAPGTDGLTMRALRKRHTGSTEDFPQDVMELQYFLNDPEPGQRVIATPGASTRVPIWILGSSEFGARLAAKLGLPYAFASHFAPAQLESAIALYRGTFQPSEQLDQPYVMLGMNVYAGDSGEEAELLRTSAMQAYINLFRGHPGKLPPPDPEFWDSLSAPEKHTLDTMGRCSAIGSPQKVKQEIEAFIEQTQADELILASNIYDFDKRLRSFEIVAELFLS